MSVLLIVDDEPIVRYRIREVAESLAFDVLEAEEWLEAMTHAHNPNIVGATVDLGLPDVVSARGHIGALHHAPWPVLVVTGMHCDSEAVLECENEGLPVVSKGETMQEQIRGWLRGILENG